jgi:hypothetical protein
VQLTGQRSIGPEIREEERGSHQEEESAPCDERSGDPTHRGFP